MNIIALNEDNADKYEDFLTADVTENISRNNFYGFVLEQNAPQGAIVYELLGEEGKEPTQAAIRYFKLRSEAAAGPLFDAYTDAIKKEEIKVSSFVIPVKDSAAEKTALKNAGFTVKLTEGDHIIVSLDELLALPIMKNPKVPDSIFALNQMTTRMFRLAVSKCVTLGHKGLCNDLENLPLSWFDPEVSCYSEHNGVVDGLFLFHCLPSGMLTIQLMVALGGNPQQILLGMMRQFVISLEKNYGSDVKVVLDRHNQSSMELTEKLLPRGFGIPVYKGSRQEQ